MLINTILLILSFTQMVMMYYLFFYKSKQDKKIEEFNSKFNSDGSAKG